LGLVYSSKEYPDVNEDILDIGSISLSGANIGVVGRIVDENGAPIAGLVIVATDIDDIDKDDILGRVVSAGDGTWSIYYLPSLWRDGTDANPDIVITILDRVGIRQLATTSEIGDVTLSVLDMGDIVIPRQVADGWAATLGGNGATRLSANNDFRVLVDNQIAFAEIIRMINAATLSVHLMQLWMDIDVIATYANDGSPRDLILESLLAADQRGVVVRVLLNTNVIVPDTFDEIRDWFQDRGPNNVQVREFPMSYESMHAKALIADPGIAAAEGIVMGSPFQQGYWDTQGHLVAEPGRGIVPLQGIGHRPVHDVSVLLHGPATADVADLFASMWNRESDRNYLGLDKLPDPGPRPAAAGTQSIQILRSVPRNVVLVRNLIGASVTLAPR
jgi:hypothetical protein